MNCPFRNFEECPEHNKKGGCSFWIAYTTNREGIEAHIERLRSYPHASASLGKRKQPWDSRG